MLSNGTAMVMLFVMPLIAVLPDILIACVQKIFFPTPTDIVMLKQKEDPGYIYEGFRDVYIPPLPEKEKIYEDTPESKKLMLERMKSRVIV